MHREESSVILAHHADRCQQILDVVCRHIPGRSQQRFFKINQIDRTRNLFALI